VILRVVLDANVLVSGILGGHRTTPPVQIVDAWREGVFELSISAEIIAEVQRTLGKVYFRSRLSNDQIDRAVALLRRRSNFVRLHIRVQGVVRDPDDDVILSTALSAEADYLVSGDKALLELQSYGAIRIVSPREFLDILSDQA
jgi:putative PIN family toxin of toxin-antitoxin system